MNRAREDPGQVRVAALVMPLRVEDKWRQVIRSRKVWAGLIGLVATLGLWWLGEIDGRATVEALTWVVGIFIGAVALEDGLAQLIRGLAAALLAQTPALPPHTTFQQDTLPQATVREPRVDEPKHVPGHF